MPQPRAGWQYVVVRVVLENQDASPAQIMWLPDNSGSLLDSGGYDQPFALFQAIGGGGWIVEPILIPPYSQVEKTLWTELPENMKPQKLKIPIPSGSKQQALVEIDLSKSMSQVPDIFDSSLTRTPLAGAGYVADFPERCGLLSHQRIPFC